jgi:hypothetical protein
MVRNKSSLLIDEPPLQVLPTLAVAIGLNEAIFIQQLHWLLSHSGKAVKGQEGKWIYNTAEEWHEKFPFWSVSTIKRIITGLRKEGLIKAGRFNRMTLDQTRWYTIDYEALNKKSPIGSDWHNGSGQVDTMTLGQSDPMLPEIKNTNQREKNNGGIDEPPQTTAAASPLPSPSGVVSLNGTGESAIWAALEKLNQGIRRGGGNPITGTKAIAARLAQRGVTIDEMRTAWKACKSNAENPVGAFVFWTREEYTPPPKKGFETKTDEQGNDVVWVDGQGWMTVTGSHV